MAVGCSRSVVIGLVLALLPLGADAASPTHLPKFKSTRRALEMRAQVAALQEQALRAADRARKAMLAKDQVQGELEAQERQVALLETRATNAVEAQQRLEQVIEMEEGNEGAAVEGVAQLRRRLDGGYLAVLRDYRDGKRRAPPPIAALAARDGKSLGSFLEGVIAQKERENRAAVKAAQEKADRAQQHARAVIANALRVIDSAKAHLEAARDPKPKARLAALRRAAEEAKGHAKAEEEAAADAWRIAQQTVAEAIALEATATRARFVASDLRARRDQHLMQLVSVAERRRYRDAVKRYRAFAVIEPKPGEVSQDAVASAPEKDLFAISDGVTNSFLSGELSRALVVGWTENPPDTVDDFQRFLEVAQKRWGLRAAPHIATISSRGWYNEGRDFAGHATFLGVKLERLPGRQLLRAVGMGDSVLLIVREGKLWASWPPEQVADFTTAVRALPSQGSPKFKVLRREFEVEPDDEVYLLTDALGKWAHQEINAGRDPFPSLRAIRSPRDMARFTDAARGGALVDRHKLDVDDTSMVRFVVPRPAAKD